MFKNFNDIDNLKSAINRNLYKTFCLMYESGEFTTDCKKVTNSNQYIYKAIQIYYKDFLQNFSTSLNSGESKGYFKASSVIDGSFNLRSNQKFNSFTSLKDKINYVKELYSFSNVPLQNIKKFDSDLKKFDDILKNPDTSETYNKKLKKVESSNQIKSIVGL